MADTKTKSISDLMSIKDWTTFKDMVVEVWQHGFMGVDIGSLLIAVLIFAGFLLIRGLFSKFMLMHLHNYASKSTNSLDDKIVDALIPPIKFIPVILGLFFALQYVGINDSGAEFFNKIIRSLIAFTIFWAIHRAAEPVSHSVKFLEKMFGRSLVRWIFRAIKVMIIFVGGAVILEVWGIAVGPLLAGLGLFGAAVALGAQDLFKNLIAGVTILAEKRFYPGEWILVDGVVEGVVEDIGFRSTKVRRFDKAPVHVPNAALSDVAVTNFSRMTHRRIKWLIGVEYRTTVDQLKTVRDGIMDYILENDDFAKPEEVGGQTYVRVDSFNNSSIDIMVYCFSNEIKMAEYAQVKEDLAIHIKNVVEEKAGTGFAFPSQSIYVESFPGDAPEIFVPPKD